MGPTLSLEREESIADSSLPIRGRTNPGSGRFSPMEVVEASVAPHEKYCVGYTGTGGYCLALVMGIGLARETLAKPGSRMLNSIVAYDAAEVEDAYLGQINMITVSSFCGPQGVIWGYDIARNDIRPPALLDEEQAEEFEGINIINGDAIRQAARMLYGTTEKRHFPFLPGSHVPCAGKYRSYRGNAVLYAAAAVGIPEDRSRHACLLMEDVGKCGRGNMIDGGGYAKSRIASNIIGSVSRIGEHHGISYRDVIVDVVLREVPEGHMGCALVAAPYFHLAGNAYHERLDSLSIQEWYGMKRKHFMDSYDKRDYEDIMWDLFQPPRPTPVGV